MDKELIPHYILKVIRIRTPDPDRICLDGGVRTLRFPNAVACLFSLLCDKENIFVRTTLFCHHILKIIVTLIWLRHTLNLTSI